MRIMDDEKIFICPICGKIFYNNIGLNRHLSRTHSNYCFIINSPFLIKVLMKMEKNIEVLKNIDKIIDILGSIQLILRDIREQLSINPPTYSSQSDVNRKEVNENIPSFLVENPWIKVLSRKGRKV